MTADFNTTVALTGATGFLGGYLIKNLVQAGYHVRALTRRPQDRVDGVTWIPGDVTNPDSLETLASDAAFFIHAAGLVKALSLSDFRAVNKMGSWHALQAAKHTKVKKFLMISSMAAREPDLSHYSRSKWEGDNALLTFKWPFDWMIMRPGGIYGPGDHEFLPMFQLAQSGKFLTAGGQDNRFALIHVADMAALVVKQLQSDFTQTIIEADDGHKGGYSAADLVEVFKAIGLSEKIHIWNAPAFAIKTLGYVNSLKAMITRQAEMITHKKANELTHPDWTVHSPHTLDFSAHYDLQSGFQETLDYYRENNLLS